MDVSKFNEKLNRVEGHTYVIEETVYPVNGVYEKELEHDNVNITTLNVYTGSKLTGDKIDSYSTSTPSMTPWKTIIRIFSSISPLYISYETSGDQIEAEDINNLQDAVNDTQKNLNDEINRATNAEKVLTDNLNTETSRAKSSENTLTINLNSEIYRAKNTESILTTNLDSEINRAKAKESSIDTELANRYTKDKVYTKDEVLQKISELINNAPNVLDTFKEIADALGNDPNFATTMTTMLAGKVDKVSGKGLSTNDYTDTEKANLADTNNKKHEHGNKSVIDGITATLIGYWNAAYTHISDTIKHITSDERNLWNTVSNKLDKIAGKSLSTNDFDNNYKGKIDGISSNANKVEVSTTNGNIKIDGAEKTVYTHPSGTNPHGTTKTDVGLGNVTNDPQVKRSEMGAANGVATLDSSGINNQAPKPHTHDDRYYTESEANSKFATKDEISTAGYGDMLKSVYDTNNNGVVDRAEKLSTARKINGVNFDGSSDITINDDTNLSLSGGIVTGRTLFNQGISIINSNSGGGTTGFMYIAQIKITGNYQNQPISFDVRQRDRYGQIIIKFNSMNSSDPTLAYINKIGNIGVYIVKSTTSTWDLYIQKSEAYDSIDIVGFSKGDYMTGTSITWKSSTITALPSGYIEATIASIDMLSTRAIQDSDGKQINSTYVKKGMTWNDLEGV
ncbi:hypothetical protein [Clostridium beijerinckii]|uniref:hypothetical protein n=1 Tax=Clostridium beijerinckii TaxID=1520 RepID=UPI00098C6699|nr:hypothetical protein [Clostridium beijerinckii]NRT76290.1 hypothetical protein [Clostridium beijerinckii]OOM48672.1 hypothetical protein CBEIJ_21440 [Clostridium beijerinckii]